MPTTSKKHKKGLKKAFYLLTVKKKLRKTPVWKRKYRSTLNRAPWYRRWESLPMLIKRIEKQKAFQNLALQVKFEMENKILNNNDYF